MVPNRYIILLITLAFVSGWAASLGAGMYYSSPTVNEPITDKARILLPSDFQQPEERASPGDWINHSQIHVYSNRIIIDLENAEWSEFTDTNSMDPVIDFGTNAIQIRPTSPEQIQVGDIISFGLSDDDPGTIIHRVIGIGNDDEGWFALTQGDNNPSPDPGVRRFEHIKRVTVAIIY